MSRTLVGALVVAILFALAFAACERMVVLTPFPGDASQYVPDAYADDGGQALHDGGFPFPDAAAGLD